jgi:DUF4097 and DUF4098 domain-containing protein YvlB
VRKIALCAVVLLVAALAARADDWNKNFPLTGKPQLVVETDDGNITVATGSAQQVQAEVHTTGYRIANDDVRIEAHQDGNRVELRVRRPNHTFNLGFGSHHSIRVTLTVPPDSDLDLHTKDGNVEAAGVRGRHQIRTGDGNVKLRDVDGAVSVSTGDGNVIADGRFDEFSARTGDGNIDATVRSGSKMSSSWSMHTGDGNVHLALPANFAANIDAHSCDGHVQSELPITVSGSFKENGLRGQMNGGGPTLELRTGDGDIRLTKVTGSL